VKLTFDKKHVAQLLEISKKADNPTPIFEQVLTPEYWRDDLDPDRRALLDAEISDTGFAFSARPEDVDPAKVPRGLILVGDQGVYLMSQQSNEEVKAMGVSHVAYANEIDPTKMASDDWYDNKRAAFGGDDGTIHLPAEHVEAGLRLPGDHFVIELTPTQYGIVAPK
jgi:hypothetical protein